MSELERVPTVKIESGDSYAIINKSDFVEGVHKIWEGVEEVAAASVAEVEKLTGEVVAEVKPAGWGAAPSA